MCLPEDQSLIGEKGCITRTIVLFTQLKTGIFSLFVCGSFLIRKIFCGPFLTFSIWSKAFFQRLTFSKSEFSHFQARLKAKTFFLKSLCLRFLGATVLNCGNWSRGHPRVCAVAHGLRTTDLKLCFRQFHFAVIACFIIEWLLNKSPRDESVLCTSQFLIKQHCYTSAFQFWTKKAKAVKVVLWWFLCRKRTI